MERTFLRRIGKRSYHPGNEISQDVFICQSGEIGISLYLRSATLATSEGLREYQLAYRRKNSGDLFGVCELSEAIIPNYYQVVHTPEDTVNDPYGDLHYELQPCPNGEVALELAGKSKLLLPYMKST